MMEYITSSIDYAEVLEELKTMNIPDEVMGIVKNLLQKNCDLQKVANKTTNALYQQSKLVTILENFVIKEVLLDKENLEKKDVSDLKMIFTDISSTFCNLNLLVGKLLSKVKTCYEKKAYKKRLYKEKCGFINHLHECVAKHYDYLISQDEKIKSVFSENGRSRENGLRVKNLERRNSAKYKKSHMNSESDSSTYEVCKNDNTVQKGSNYYKRSQSKRNHSPNVCEKDPEESGKRSRKANASRNYETGTNELDNIPSHNARKNKKGRRRRKKMKQVKNEQEENDNLKYSYLECMTQSVETVGVATSRKSNLENMIKPLYILVQDVLKDPAFESCPYVAQFKERNEMEENTFNVIDECGNVDGEEECDNDSESLNDESPDDEFPNDESPNDEYPNDESPNDEYPNDEYPNDEYPNDEFPNDESPNDESPNGDGCDGGEDYSNDSEADRDHDNVNVLGTDEVSNNSNSDCGTIVHKEEHSMPADVSPAESDSNAISEDEVDDADSSGSHEGGRQIEDPTSEPAIYGKKGPQTLPSDPNENLRKGPQTPPGNAPDSEGVTDEEEHYSSE